MEKYLEYEQRDPVTVLREDGEAACSEWDRYAAEQYEILLTEEACENENRYGHFWFGAMHVGLCVYTVHGIVQ